MAALTHHDDDRGFRVVLLDRPETRNAIDNDVVSGLSDLISEAPGPVVVLGSTDSRSFSSGADFKLPDAERAILSDSLYELYRLMRTTPKIIVSAASGPAVGGGAQLLIASDIRFVSPEATIRFMGPGHGLAVGAWGLPSLVGRGRAMDLCLSMRTVGAEEALSMGLFEQVVDAPLEAATDYAASIAALDAAAVAAIKAVVSIDSTEEALQREREHNSTWDGRMGPA